MDFRELYDNAKTYKLFYYLASLPHASREASELEYMLHRLGLATAVAIIDKNAVILGVRQITSLPGESDLSYNEIIAASLSKCFNARVIMGRGEDIPCIYSYGDKPQKVEAANLEDEISLLTGCKIYKEISTASSHCPAEGFNAAVLREKFYFMSKKFGEDAIATSISETAELNSETCSWLTMVRNTITNQNALSYINNEVANNPFKKIKFGGETFFDLIEGKEI